MGRQVNQLNVYLLAAVLMVGSVAGYILGLRTSQEMWRELSQLESELATLKWEFTSFSGRDWHLAYSFCEAFERDVVQVQRHSLGPFYLSGNEVRFVWLFKSQGYPEGPLGNLEITFRHMNGTVVGRRTTSATFSIG